MPNIAKVKNTDNERVSPRSGCSTVKTDRFGDVWRLSAYNFCWKFAQNMGRADGTFYSDWPVYPGLKYGATTWSGTIALESFKLTAEKEIRRHIKAVL